MVTKLFLSDVPGTLNTVPTSFKCPTVSVLHWSHCFNWVFIQSSYVVSTSYKTDLSLTQFFCFCIQSKIFLTAGISSEYKPLGNSYGFVVICFNPGPVLYTLLFFFFRNNLDFKRPAVILLFHFQVWTDLTVTRTRTTRGQRWCHQRILHCRSTDQIMTPLLRIIRQPEGQRFMLYTLYPF